MCARARVCVCVRVYVCSCGSVQLCLWQHVWQWEDVWQRVPVGECAWRFEQCAWQCACVYASVCVCQKMPHSLQLKRNTSCHSLSLPPSFRHAYTVQDRLPHTATQGAIDTQHNLPCTHTHTHTATDNGPLMHAATYTHMRAHAIGHT